MRRSSMLGSWTTCRDNLNAAHASAKSRLQPLADPLYYHATSARSDGTIPFDMRHYDASVIDQLLRLTYLHLCEALPTSHVMDR